MGGKARIAKHIVPIMTANRKPGQYFVEPFCGGCNVTSAVDGPRIANDVNAYIIAFWKRFVCTDWQPPRVSKYEWQLVKSLPFVFDPAFVGWVGIGCSYAGLFFGGYSGVTKKKTGVVKDYQQETLNVVNKQREKLRGVEFHAGEYWRLDKLMPEESIVYADPPYAGVANYKASTFDSIAFWKWARRLSERGHTIFVSEYAAPKDFVCVWEKELARKLYPNAHASSKYVTLRQAVMVERLFVPR